MRKLILWLGLLFLLVFSGMVAPVYASEPPAATITGTNLDETNLDIGSISLTIQGTSFNGITKDNISLLNAPTGLSVESISVAGDICTVNLAFNGTDFDTNITNLGVTVTGGLTAGTFPLTASNTLTITATDDAESISISDDGNILEGQENGEEITVTLAGGTFVPVLDPVKWSVVNRPAGVNWTVSRVDAHTAKITLSGNATVPYTGDITNLTVTCDPSQYVDSFGSASLSDSDGVTLKAYPRATNDPINITHKTYKTGDQITIGVQFNKTVRVIGTPYIPVTIGSDTVQAQYLSGDNTNNLSFRYTVEAARQDTDGITLGTAIILPAGATIKDTVGSDAGLNINRGDTSDILVDGVCPTILGAERLDDNHIRVTLSEPCINTAKGTAGGFLVNETGAIGTTYTVSATSAPDSTHVVLSLAINIGASAREGITVKYDTTQDGTIQDVALNPLADNPVGKTIDPWDIASPTLDNMVIANYDDYFDLTFSEGVYGSDSGSTQLTTANLDFTFAANGSTATAAIDRIEKTTGGALTGGETVIRVYLTITNTPKGLETITIKPKTGASIYDKAGNPMDAAQSKTVNLKDLRPPKMVSVVVNSNTQITLTLSKDCIETTKNNDCGFIVEELNNVMTWYPVTKTVGTGNTIVVTVPDMAISAREGIQVKYYAVGNGFIQDWIGNLMATDGIGVTAAGWDTTPPTLNSAALAADNGYIDLTFSEGVYGSDNATAALTTASLDFAFAANGSTANAAIDRLEKTTGGALLGGETVIRIYLTVTGTPDGAETITIKPKTAAAIYDKAGNPMDAAQSKTVNLKDKTSPTLLTAVMADDCSYVDLTFSEAVYGAGDGVTALTKEKLVMSFLSNVDGTATNTAISSLNMTSATVARVYLTVSGVPNGQETVTLTPKDGASVYDQAGNPMDAAQSKTANLRDTILPTISSAMIAANNTSVQITFSEGVYGIGTGPLTTTSLDRAFTINTGRAEGAEITSVTKTDGWALTGGETTIKVGISVSGTPNGLETLALKPKDGNSIFDRAGNAMSAAQSRTVNLIDKTPPIIIDAAQIDNTHIRVTLSKPCNQTAKPNNAGFIVKENSAAATAYLVSWTVAPAPFHVDLTVADMSISAREGITVSYKTAADGDNGTVIDIMGNAMVTDNTGKTIDGWDTNPPTLDSAALANDNSYIDLTFSEGVYGSDNGTSPLTSAKLGYTFTANGSSATAAIDRLEKTTGGVLTGGETVIRVYLTISGTPDGQETITIKPKTAAAVFDKAGNPMDAGQSKTVNLGDKKPPTMISATITADNSYIDLTFSKGIYGNAGGTLPLTAIGMDIAFLKNANGVASDAVIASINKTNGNPLTGGETSVRVNLTITGIPNGQETVTLKPKDGNSIFDQFGNPMDVSQSQIVNLKDMTLYSITVSSPTNGTISADHATATSGDTISLTITPDGGYRLKSNSLKYNDGSGHDIIGTSFTMPGHDVTVSGQFELLPPNIYSVTIADLINGSISANPTSATSGDTITLIINPAPGYQLKTGTLNYNDGSSDSAINETSKSFAMPAANVMVSAEFELIPNEPAAVTGITLNKSSTTIVIGSFEKLIYSIEPSNAADKSVIWFSSNTSVATVDTLGIVTGVSAGTATITVTTNDGGKTAACIVTVIGASHGDSNTTDLILTVVETTTGEGVLNPALGGIIGLAADVVVNIPGGALLGNSNITVTVNRETTSPAVSPDLQPLGDVYHFQVGGAAHYTFAKPITLSFNFNPSTVPVGANPAVFYYDDQAKKWVNIGGVVTGSTITITIDHFSQFTVMAIKPMLQFTDLNNHWAEDFVNKLIAKGVINGYPDGSFKPEQTMTRAEFITVVARAFSLTTDEAYTLTYQDEKIIPTWAKSSVTACAKAGVLPSIWGNKLNSNNNITRAEIVYIVGQAMKIKIAPNTKLPFKDQIPSWAAGYVQWAVDYGIIIGYPNKTFKPNITATRAEACAILSKTLDK